MPYDTIKTVYDHIMFKHKERYIKRYEYLKRNFTIDPPIFADIF